VEGFHVDPVHSIEDLPAILDSPSKLVNET